MKYSVVMPCYIMSEELIELTKNTIASLGDVELIIIDDNSPLGGGYLRSVADIYLRNKENLGYGRSVNRGLKLATSPYIAISNNDIRISPNWKEVMEEVFKREDCYSCHFRMTDYDVPFKYGDKIVYDGKERWCHASFYAINRTKALFLYDETYINTFDDWDIFQMVRRAGLKQCYTDKACFQHIHSATIPKMPKHSERNTANREYFKKKWGGYPEDLFEKEFPEQMKIPYPQGFNL